MRRKLRFKFQGRRGGRYYWMSTTTIGPGESRHEQVSADVNWFWSPR